MQLLQNWLGDLTHDFGALSTVFSTRATETTPPLRGHAGKKTSARHEPTKPAAKKKLREHMMVNNLSNIFVAWMTSATIQQLRVGSQWKTQTAPTHHSDPVAGNEKIKPLSLQHAMSTTPAAAILSAARAELASSSRSEPMHRGRSTIILWPQFYQHQ